MSNFLENMEGFLIIFVELSTIALDLFGIIILIFTALKSFVKWIRHDTKLRLELAYGIALALEFKMGSEVLRTVVVNEWEELGILGAVILLRGVLTFLIHWEIQTEEASMKPKA
ncbi:MAG: DUF1622 domain-containing protein [Lachnospiraceae bacterium]|nr:DUF1622 domain-containing protein [Lachnospiraceae bacterium]